MAHEQGPGAELLREMLGQPAAVASVLEDAALERYLGRLADAVRASGELLVGGMGGSLHAGLVLTALLRGRGVRAWALPASELLHDAGGLAVWPRLLLSQSGASVEITRLLELWGGDTYGLTLDPDSALGQAGAGVVPGGPERAYAATRSFTTTVAALYRLAAELGADVPLEGLAPSLEAALGPLPGLEPARAKLERADTIFVTGRGVLHGLAEYVALLLMELTRLPCAALEAAQFRHGPIEAAGERLGVVALAAPGETGELVWRLAGELAAVGSPTVVLDAGGVGDRAGARAGDGTGDRAGETVTVALPAAGAAAAVLPLAVVAQRLAVMLAEARGIEPGVPLRSGKVTRVE